MLPKFLPWGVEANFSWLVRIRGEEKGRIALHSFFVADCCCGIGVWCFVFLYLVFC